MSESVQHVISHYGYWAMFIGALIEGETFLIAGGIAAKHGLLGLPGLIGMAVVGSYLHDNIFFYLGRFGGQRVLQRSPKIARQAQRGLALFDRYGLWMVLGCRFFYGLRTIVPTVIGMSPMRTWLFAILSFIGACLWSVTFIVGGYLFGELIQIVLARFHGYESTLFIVGCAVLILLGVIYLYLWLKRRRNQMK